MKIYISSTYTDLKEHRESIISVISSVKKEVEKDHIAYVVTNIENSVSLEAIKNKLEESSIFILLLGWRYGYIPDGYDKSIVEIEYEIAVENELTILCYIIDENYPIPPKFYEFGIESSKLAKFKEQISQKHITRKFGSPDELLQVAYSDLSRMFSTSMSKAVRYTLDMPYMERELEIVKKENKTLVNKLEIFNIKWKNLVPAEPIWKTRNFAIDSTLCFVLMPFKQRFFDIYEESVLPAIQNSGLRGTHAGIYSIIEK